MKGIFTLILTIMFLSPIFSQRGFLEANGCNKLILEWGQPGMVSSYKLLDTCKNEILVATHGAPEKYKLVYEEFRENNWLKTNDWLRILKHSKSEALMIFICKRTMKKGKPKYEVLWRNLYMLSDVPEIRVSSEKDPVIELNISEF